MRILTRRDVGARPFTSPAPKVLLAQRREVTFHYPGEGTPPRPIKDLFAWIERIHMDERGWRGVGYNYIIGFDGTVSEGCGRDVRGAHSPPHNVDGFGVMIWTSNGHPTAEALRSARELYQRLCRETGRTLTAGWHGRDFPTKCPGDTLRNWVTSGMKAPAVPHTSPPPAKLPTRRRVWKVSPHRVRTALVGLNAAGKVVTSARPGQTLDVRRTVTRWGHRWAVTRWGTHFRLDHLTQERTA